MVQIEFYQLLSVIVISFFGWWMVHYLTAIRDLANERRKVRITYLLEAYRRLEAAAQRPKRTTEQWYNFESAIADIQLLGTTDQVKEIIKFVNEFNTPNNNGADQILRLLREDLRKEMGLSNNVEKIRIFRFR